MATTQIVFSDAGTSDKGGGIIPTLDNEEAVSETITPTGTSAMTTITAPLIGNRPVCLVSTDTAVYVAIGTAPNATTGTTKRYFYPAGAMFGIICKAGDKAAVVTA